MAFRLRRRLFRINTPVPVVSFSFDDAPTTAFTSGSEILDRHSARATYFMSLGLLGSETEVGTIASAQDLRRAVEQGHELGCHTFDHLDAWYTPTQKFLDSIDRNSKALEEVLPGQTFRTFAYPKSGAKLSTKLPLESRFACCRGGGQTANTGVTDLNLLNAFFLNDRVKNILDVQDVIDRNASSCGWLIIATHDVNDHPSPHGCTPQFFSAVVACAAQSGALLLPIAKAFDKLNHLS